MSDQGYSQPEEKQEEEDTGLFCRNCSAATRKLGYYLTVLAGVVFFILGIFSLFGASVYLLIMGSLLFVLSPLWIKSPKNLCIELKNPIRLVSTLIFLGFLIATISSSLIIKNDVLTIIFGIGLALSGIWYFLSFFKNGQQACIAFIKTCCGKGEEKQQEQVGDTVEESA